MAKENSADYPTSMISAPGSTPELNAIPQPDESQYKGRYRHRKDGFVYKHAVMDHPRGLTHKAMVSRRTEMIGGKETLIHSGLFWEGTPEDFREQFDKL